MKVGYVRISTKGQNTARQDELMGGLGVERIFTDKMSGKDTERPGLQEMMNYVREGDIVVVESYSRIARNTQDLLNIISTLKGKKVEFISQKENFNTNSHAGKFMLTVFAGLVEFEREMILERQREGIDIAMAEGKMGRPKKAIDSFESAYLDVKAGKLSAAKAARQIGISRSTWYRKVHEYEDDNRIIDI